MYDVYQCHMQTQLNMATDDHLQPPLVPPQSLPVKKTSVDSGYRSRQTSTSELQAIREDEQCQHHLITGSSTSRLETAPTHLQLPTICLTSSPGQSLLDIRRGSEDSCNSSQCPSDAGTPAVTRPLLSDHAKRNVNGHRCQQRSAPSPAISQNGHSPKTYSDEIILRETVRCEMPTFVTNTDFKELSSHLFAKRILHAGDYATLTNIPSCKERGNHFYIELLPRKGRHAYRRLYKCLRNEANHAGHRDLFEILDTAMKEGRPPQTSSDSSPTESCAAHSPPEHGKNSQQCCRVQ